MSFSRDDFTGKIKNLRPSLAITMQPHPTSLFVKFFCTKYNDEQCGALQENRLINSLVVDSPSLKRTYYTQFRVFNFGFGLYRAAKHNWQNSKVCRPSKKLWLATFFPCLCWSASVNYSFPFLSCVPPHSTVLTNLYWHKINIANAINFCLVLASLGKCNKVNCPSFTRKKNLLEPSWTKS